MTSPVRIASVNVNGVRAAYRKGMGDWLDARGVDILALQEVRASTDDVTGLLGDGWTVLHDAATAKGRAGAARREFSAHRVALGDDDFDSAGRWLEADLEVGGTTLTVVSTYVHSGEVDTPKQVEKYRFLDAMEARLPELAAHSRYALVVGDLNVGHRELDIKNWRGNRKNAGFLPRERAYFDRFFGALDEPIEGVDGSTGPGLGWVDVGLARQGVRQRRRVAHRLPRRHARTRRDRAVVRRRPRRLVGHAVERPRARGGGLRVALRRSSRASQ